MIPLITIQITNEDALLFRKFQQRYAFMKFLEEIGVFDNKYKNATLSLNFGSQGEIKSIDEKKHTSLVYPQVNAQM